MTFRGFEADLSIGDFGKKMVACPFRVREIAALEDVNNAPPIDENATDFPISLMISHQRLEH